MLERLFGRKKVKPHSNVENIKEAQPSAEATAEEAESEPPTTRAAPEAQTPLSPDSPESSQASSPEGTDQPAASLELERAIAANAKHDTPETRQKLYQELLFSDLLLALAENAEKSAVPAEGTPAPGGNEQQISVALMKNPSGVQFAASFTSPEAAKRWRKEGGNFASMRGRDVFKLLEASPAEVIVINPGSSPFIVLPKIDYKQLALGVVPQNPQSPVHVAKAEPAQSGPQPGPRDREGGQSQDDQMQVAFPPDVFNDDQKSLINTIMMVHTQVEAAVFGAIRPPKAKENEWVRTIFIRPMNIEPKQEPIQALCKDLKESIISGNTLFAETPFEVGVMPDPQFWVAMHQNSLVAFDKNPPPLPKPADTAKDIPDGVADAKVES